MQVQFASLPQHDDSAMSLLQQVVDAAREQRSFSDESASPPQPQSACTDHAGMASIKIRRRCVVRVSICISVSADGSQWPRTLRPFQ
jgi:hypothetical protein